MITVAICDDEILITSELEQSIFDIFDKLNIQAEIDIFFAGSELYKNMTSGVCYDLIFLDIEFAKGEINGIEVGNLIRNTYNNNTSSIIYISWEMNYAMQLFDIRPLNFLIKPLNDNKIEEVLRLYLKLRGLWSEFFTYKIGHDVSKVQMKDIVYLESAKRKLILHLADGKKEEFYGTLKDTYQNQLQRFDFLFIHAAYVVNYDYIASLKYSEVILLNVTRIPISHHRRKEIGKAYYGIFKRKSAQ
jgi:DNA-binding LytR/AlgR family response regulator